MAQQACLSDWTLAKEGCHTVMAGGAVEANGDRTVINVLTAVVSSPAVNTDTGVATNGVEASTTIMAGVGLHEALIDILGTVLSCPLWRTLAVVGVYSIYTYASVHALVAWAVIHIILTVVSLKPW